MKKNFSHWHIVKTELQNRQSKHTLFFQERQVWHVICGLNIGIEQDGKGDFFSRPVLILRKFNRNMFWGIPLTTKEKPNSDFHFSIKSRLQKESWAILSQIRAFDTKRLLEYKGKISPEEFDKVKQKIRSLLT